MTNPLYDEKSYENGKISKEDANAKGVSGGDFVFIKEGIDPDKKNKQFYLKHIPNRYMENKKYLTDFTSKFLVETLMSGIYQAMLGEKATVIRLLYSIPPKLVSCMIDNNPQSFFEYAKLSEDITLVNAHENAAKVHILLKEKNLLEQFYQITATCLINGEIDFNPDNIMVQDNATLAKIDHGESANFAISPADLLSMYINYPGYSYAWDEKLFKNHLCADIFIKQAENQYNNYTFFVDESIHNIKEYYNLNKNSIKYIDNAFNELFSKIYSNNESIKGPSLKKMLNNLKKENPQLNENTLINIAFDKMKEQLIKNITQRSQQTKDLGVAVKIQVMLENKQFKELSQFLNDNPEYKDKKINWVHGNQVLQNQSATEYLKEHNEWLKYNIETNNIENAKAFLTELKAKLKSVTQNNAIEDIKIFLEEKHKEYLEKNQSGEYNLTLKTIAFYQTRIDMPKSKNFFEKIVKRTEKNREMGEIIKDLGKDHKIALKQISKSIKLYKTHTAKNTKQKSSIGLP